MKQQIKTKKEKKGYIFLDLFYLIEKNGIVHKRGGGGRERSLVFISVPSLHSRGPKDNELTTCKIQAMEEGSQDWWNEKFLLNFEKTKAKKLCSSLVNI
jgi:hypothetical protein